MTAAEQDDDVLQVIALYEACLELCDGYSWHELPKAWNTKTRQRFTRMAVQLIWTLHDLYPLSLPDPSTPADDFAHMSGELT